jgi:anti-sigma B factor antagonist
MALRLSAGGLGRYVVITIGGELDMTTAPALAEYLTAVLGRQAGQDVILDVRGVSFADVAGLRALLAADCKVKDSGGSLRLAGAPRQLRRVLAITGLTERLATGMTPSKPSAGASASSVSWMSRGACQGEDPELFFPISARGSAGRRCVKQGRRRPRQDHHFVHVIRRLRPGSSTTPQPQKE